MQMPVHAYPIWFPNGIATANGIATTLHSEILSLGSTERG